MNRIKRSALYLHTPFILIKWAIGIFAWLVSYLVSKFVLCRSKKGEPLSKFHSALIRWSFKFTARMSMIMVNCWKITVKQTYVDYSKYLGPNWKDDGINYKRSGSVVTNHTSWIDILVQMYR